MIVKYEYATLEWLWDSSNLRANLPNNQEIKVAGSYAEVVNLLTQLGSQGWDVVTCTSGGNWLFWTLKRPTDGTALTQTELFGGGYAPVDK
jgi:hypothetical protein